MLTYSLIHVEWLLFGREDLRETRTGDNKDSRR
jgi:hypothetical protein